MLRTLKVRAWCRAVFTVGFGRSRGGCSIHIRRGFIVGVVLAWFTCAFTAVTAVAVT